jgi:hypothetical protein
MALVPILIRSKAGIKRDGTPLDSDYYVDGQWVRFQRGMPRKIAGYITINRFGSDVSRGIRSFAQDDRTFIFTAGATKLETTSMDISGNTTVVNNRTPLTYAADSKNAWQFDFMVDTSTVPPVNQIIAQVAPNNQWIANASGGQVFIGKVNDAAPLVEITTLASNYISATGGIVVLFPYLVVFGSDGSLGWSAPGQPTVFNTYTSSIYSSGIALTAATVVGFGAFTVSGNATTTFVAGMLVAFGSASGPFYTVNSSYWNGLTPGTTLVFLETVFTAVYAIGTFVYLQTQVLTGAGSARVTNQKIVQGYALRAGGGSSPSGLFWSLDSVIRMTFVGGETVFQFDTISPTSSILSAASVVEFDGIYYWAGSDRFLLFNGVVRELPNDLNINYFFDNINRSYTSRVFGFKVPKYSEIWWCFPFGASTECNHAIIYNIRENTWYDTKLPNSGRSAAEFLATFGRPLMTGVDPYQLPVPYGQPASPVTYRLWQHETGVDEVDITDVYAVQSYFETANFSLPSQTQGKLKALRVSVVEPDFLQKGDMTLIITGQANARATTVLSQTESFPAVATIPADQVVFFKEQRRLLRFRFESNVVGGDYQMGKVVAHIEETDATYLGSV